MNGYLMQEQKWTPGEDLFIESFASEGRYGVVFEDDGEAAYFYAVEKDENGAGAGLDIAKRVAAVLHILDRNIGSPTQFPRRLRHRPPQGIRRRASFRSCSPALFAPGLLAEGPCHLISDI